jgi:hexosaminidase
MNNNIAIIPNPVKLKKKLGSFQLDENTFISGTEEAEDSMTYLAGILRIVTGFSISICKSLEKSSPNNSIVFVLDRKISKNMDAYFLEVNKRKILIKAATKIGLFYGIQTLLQLMPPNVWRSAPIDNTAWHIPCVEIRDWARFKWRGMHLDVARHYMPKEFIKKFIALLAMHKFNIFHWHLTDDQGWRIEIKKYPELTRISAWRKETIIGHYYNRPRQFDGTPHGGFYTQDDIREIVSYAEARNITVIPEIEMPGHAQAVLAAYPELSCTRQNCEVSTLWGVHENIFCAGNDEVFIFLENVLREVMELFPSKYIHIGGDEVPKKYWKMCPKCQKRIEKEGLLDENELQSWFIRKIVKFLNRHNRLLIGWDEITEGGLPPNATIMSWRGEELGIKAIKSGYDVVFTPNTHTYFDYYQTEDQFSELCIEGYTSLEKIYSYEPVSELFTNKDKSHLLGIQGQLWSEYMPVPKRVEYMAFPRTCALSEVLWSPKDNRNYKNFIETMKIHLKRFDIMDVNYKNPNC